MTRCKNCGQWIEFWDIEHDPNGHPTPIAKPFWVHSTSLRRQCELLTVAEPKKLEGIR
jgi:hypothetical protein